MFVHFFIRRPVFASVCSLLIILIGLVGYTRLPVQEYPSIDPPVVSVSTVYPGANPKVVETEVTEILEDQLNGIEGIKSLRSESREQVSSITIEFELDRDIEAAAQDVRSRVSRAARRLPQEVEEPVTRKREGDVSPIVWFAIYGENFSTLELTDYADRFVVDSLETVRGVSNVFIGGERRYAMRLWLDPQRLAARQLTALDVEQALRRENIEIPSGIIEGESSEYSVRTLGRLQTPPEYDNLIIRRNPSGTLIRFKDVGRAEIGAENERSFVRFNGQPAVALGVVKLSQSNTLAVAKGAKAKMEELSRDFPEGMNYKVSFDRSEFVQLAIDEVWAALYMAILLVILVIFIFLRDWRATIIPAVTIPISLIGAFAIMFLQGYSINTLTLFALTLATGLVVDDTIVVLENIVRYIQEKKMTPYRAAMEGVGEVVFAVIATTVVLIAVFVPVGFSTGNTGRLFAEFALTLAGSVVLSSFVALTLAPALSARLLQRDGEMKGWLFAGIEWFFKTIENIYQRSLAVLMRFWPIAVIGFVLSIAGTIHLFNQLPQEFLPKDDRGAIYTIVSAPEGVTINYTDKIVQQVEEIYSQVPEVKSYFMVGAFGRGTPGAVNRAFAFVRLQHWRDRSQPEQAQQAIVRQLFRRFSAITGAFVLPINPSSLPGAGLSQPIQLVLQGNDLEELAEFSEKIAIEASQLPEIRNLRSDLKINKPELTISIDRAKAANLGISVQDVSRTLQILLGGQQITSFNRGQRRYEVVVQADKQFRASPEDIRDLYVRTSQGQLVPLSGVVKLKTNSTPPQINHYNRFRSASLEGSPAPGASLADALDAVEKIARETLPSNIRTTWAGQSLEFKQAGQSTLYIFLLSLVFIFLVLAAQFESYIDPIIILLAVPLSLLGAFASLLLAGLPLNIYSQIGLVMLIGLATKNSILIVEFANQLRDQGKPIAIAAIEAGKVRFRPILMTAFSTIFGLLPLALATGAGAAARVSIGMAVVGGMLVSTFLSLYIVPVFYVMATQARYRIMGKV
ncbi:MAG: efflux RND transporter permease subunit [Oscillatoria sp. SIO1A7]|nr:efflux RND transporter permease subunit [Oscillatoria sp. SIO1A7]